MSSIRRCVRAAGTCSSPTSPTVQTCRGRVKNSGPDAPLLVPVAYGVTGTQIAQAKKDYQRVLKGPIKTYAFLAAMDDALAARQKLLKSKTV